MICQSLISDAFYTSLMFPWLADNRINSDSKSFVHNHVYQIIIKCYKHEIYKEQNRCKVVDYCLCMQWT